MHQSPSCESSFWFRDPVTLLVDPWEWEGETEEGEKGGREKREGGREGGRKVRKRKSEKGGRTKRKREGREKMGGRVCMREGEEGRGRVDGWERDRRKRWRKEGKREQGDSDTTITDDKVLTHSLCIFSMSFSWTLCTNSSSDLCFSWR